MMSVMKFFGIPVALFRKEWSDLSEKDKEQLKEGCENGSLNY